MAELLFTMLESLIYDITSSAIKKGLDKYRLNKFLNELKKISVSFVRKMRAYILIPVLLTTLLVVQIF